MPFLLMCMVTRSLSADASDAWLWLSTLILQAALEQPASALQAERPGVTGPAVEDLWWLPAAHSSIYRTFLECYNTVARCLPQADLFTFLGRTTSVASHTALQAACTENTCSPCFRQTATKPSTRSATSDRLHGQHGDHSRCS
jgi:hypothetical protein